MPVSTTAALHSSLSQSRTAAPGPHPGAVAIVFTALFSCSLAAILHVSQGPRFPMPNDPVTALSAYFTQNAAQAQLSGFFQLGSAIALGIYTAAVTNRMQSLGVRATGVRIALFGGWLAAFNTFIASAIFWMLAQPGVAQDATLTHAFFLFSFALDGAGYAMALGLLIAGLSVTGLFSRLLPRWLAIAGLVIAVIGELSWFQLIDPRLGILIPLTRFPGFLWLIAAGFALPRVASLQDGPREGTPA